MPEDAPSVVAGDEAHPGEGAARKAGRAHARRANRSGHRPGDPRERAYAAGVDRQLSADAQAGERMARRPERELDRDAQQLLHDPV